MSETLVERLLSGKPTPLEREAAEAIQEWRKVTAHETPDECGKGIQQLYGRWQDAENRLTQAQARCAEVERKFDDARSLMGSGPDILVSRQLLAETQKDAARYRFLAGQNNDWHVERWTDSPRASGTWKVFRGGELTIAIDSAMEPV